MKRFYIITLCMTVSFFSFGQSLDELNKPIVKDLNEVAPFHEGLAAVRKGNQWGFIDATGILVIGFRDDLVWNKEANKSSLGIESLTYPKFSDGLCIIKGYDEEGIPKYGFIDTSGKIAIEPEFINVSHFNNGIAIGIYESKSLRGKNPFQLNIYDYAFTEVIVNTSGELLWPIQERNNIVMSKKLFKLPALEAKMISDSLLAIKDKNQHWKIIKPKLQ